MAWEGAEIKWEKPYSLKWMKGVIRRAKKENDRAASTKRAETKKSSRGGYEKLGMLSDRPEWHATLPEGIGFNPPDDHYSSARTARAREFRELHTELKRMLAVGEVGWHIAGPKLKQLEEMAAREGIQLRPKEKNPMSWTIHKVAAANKKSGGHFFDPATLRGFGESIGSFRVFEYDKGIFVVRNRDGKGWKFDPKTGRIGAASKEKFMALKGPRRGFSRPYGANPYSLTQAEYKKLKTALTRAINSKDPDKIIKTVNHAEAIFEEKGFPDAWARWKVAKEDAEFAKMRGHPRQSWHNPGNAKKVSRAVFAKSTRLCSTSADDSHPSIAIMTYRRGGKIVAQAIYRKGQKPVYTVAKAKHSRRRKAKNSRRKTSRRSKARRSRR